MTVPFAEYRGERYVDLVDDAQRAGLTAWAEILRLGCGDLVDGAYFIEAQIYFVGDRDRFNYARDWPMSDEARRRVRELVKQRNEARRTLGMYHPEAYSQQELETLFTE